MGGGGGITGKDDRGYVEPEPYLYARLAALLRMTREGLMARNLLSDENKDNLDKMEHMVLSLKTISEKELNNTALTADEYDLIRTYGGQLEHFWLEANRQEMEAQGLSQSNFMSQNPAAIVADVATDPNGAILEEGTGRIFNIIVAVQVDGKVKLARGAVYSHYEFTQPLQNRLTDQQWREMLDFGKAPALPEWTSVYMAK
jgi:hypothetical protein